MMSGTEDNHRNKAEFYSNPEELTWVLTKDMLQQITLVSQDLNRYFHTHIKSKDMSGKD